MTPSFFESISNINIKDLKVNFETHYDPSSPIGTFQIGGLDYDIHSIKVGTSDENLQRYVEEIIDIRANLKCKNTRYWANLYLDIYSHKKLNFSINDFLQSLKAGDAIYPFKFGVSRVFDGEFEIGKFSIPHFDFSENAIICDDEVFHQITHSTMQHPEGIGSKKDYYLNLSLEKYLQQIPLDLHFNNRNSLIFGDKKDFFGTNYPGGAIRPLSEKNFGISTEFYTNDVDKRSTQALNYFKSYFIQNNKWNFQSTENITVFQFFENLKKQVYQISDEYAKNNDILR